VLPQNCQTKPPVAPTTKFRRTKNPTSHVPTRTPPALVSPYASKAIASAEWAMNGTTVLELVNGTPVPPTTTVTIITRTPNVATTHASVTT